MNMNSKKYIAPAILEDVDVELGCQILAASTEALEDTEVESVGQDVVNQTGFETSWE